MQCLDKGFAFLIIITIALRRIGIAPMSRCGLAGPTGCGQVTKQAVPDRADTSSPQGGSLSL